MTTNLGKLCRKYITAATIAATAMSPGIGMARSKTHFMHHSGHETPKMTNAQQLGGPKANDLEFANLKGQLGEGKSLEQSGDIKTQLEAIKAKMDAIKANELKKESPDIEN